MLKRVDTPSSLRTGETRFAVVRREVDERTSVIAVEGELDLSTAPRLKWVLIDALESGASQLVIDLSEVSFMDSTALGVLVAVNRRPDLSCPLAIVCPQEKVLQIFQFSGTDGAFAILPTLDDALERVRGQAAPAD